MSFAANAVYEDGGSEQAPTVRLSVVKDIGYDVENFILNLPNRRRVMVRGHSRSFLATPSVEEWTAANESKFHYASQDDIEALHRLRDAVEALKGNLKFQQAKEQVSIIEDAVSGLKFGIHDDRQTVLAHAYWFALCYSGDKQAQKFLDAKLNAIEAPHKGNKVTPYKYFCPRGDIATPFFLDLPPYKGNSDKADGVRQWVDRMYPNEDRSLSKKGYKGLAECVRTFMEVGRSCNALMSAKTPGEMQKIMHHIDKLTKPKWGKVANDPNCGAPRKIDLSHRWQHEGFLMQFKMDVMQGALDVTEGENKKDFLRKNIKSLDLKLKAHNRKPPF